MTSPELSTEAFARQMEERHWQALVRVIRKGKLIPVVGTDLARIEVAGRAITYDHYLAEELAKRRGITDGDLAALGTSIADATLNDVVSVCVRKDSGWRWDSHDIISQIINEASVAPPQPLLQLARITDIDLFVTASCDTLLETALRSVGEVETRVYCRSGKEDEDLPRDWRNRKGLRYLYYLMGKAEPGSQEFALCDEDVLRFMRRLHDGKYRPKKLFDALRESDLLLLGVNFDDWLARFFLWLAKDKDNLSSDEARNLREYLADQKIGQDRSLVLFLHHFSQSTIVSADHPGDFVNELYRRWSEQAGQPPSPGDATEAQPSYDMPRGAIFLSYSRGDAVPVKNLFAELSHGRLPVWYDGALRGGDQWRRKLDYNIENCGVFIAILSAGSLARDFGEYRTEWEKAVKRDSKFFGSGKSCIIPVVVDERDDILQAPQTYPGMPDHFRDLHMYHCPLGRPSAELISCLRARLSEQQQP